MSGPLASLKTLSHSSASRPLLQTVLFPPRNGVCSQVLAPAYMRPEFT